MDDSAPGGTSPSRLPSPHRAVRWLRAYNPNTSDRSGTRKAAGGRHQFYIRQGRALRSIAAEKEAFHLPLEVWKRGIERFPPRIDDYGPLGFQPIEVKADGLADAPLDTVTHHGIAERARYGEPDTRAIRLGQANEESREQRAGIPGALIISSSEIFRSQQTDTFRKASDGNLPLGAHSEFFPPAGPAAGEDGAPVLGLHAGTESMGLRAVTIIGLEGAFRHCSSSI